MKRATRKPFSELSYRQKLRRIYKHVGQEEPIETGPNNCDKDNVRPNNIEPPTVDTSRNDAVFVDITNAFAEPSEASGEGASSYESDNETNSVQPVQGNISDYYEEMFESDENDSTKEHESEEEHPSLEVCDGSHCSNFFLKHLREWALQEKTVSNDSITRLLTAMRENFPTFPKKASTLKGSQPNFDLCAMNDGEYIHFDWIQSVKNFVDASYDTGIKTLSVSVNIDGLPLYKCTNKYTTYPILMSLLEFPSKVFAIGLYCSNGNSHKGMPKPTILLDRFISDIKKLDGKLVCNVGSFTLTVGPFICDAPVRSDLKSIVGHSGYSSCERCTQHGTYLDGHVSFPQTGFQSRTDKSFKIKDDRAHHRLDEDGQGNPLENIGYPMVSGFVFDIMHSCYLGCMKRFLSRLATSKKGLKKVHIGSAAKGKFDDACKTLSKSIPTDFNRKCEGGISNLARWKATEYRTFALYTGLIVFSNQEIVSKDIFECFKLFSVALRIITLDDQHFRMNFVKSLLIQFIKESIKIFGQSFISYNIHGLEHLDSDYMLYGNLDKVSAFKFESFLGAHVKGAVLAGYKPIQQIARHLHLQNNLISPAINLNITCQREKQPCTDIICNGQSYLRVQYGATKLCRGVIGARDNAVLLKSDSVAIIRDIILTKKKIKLVIQSFLSHKPLFVSPIDSRHIGIYKVKNIQECCLVDFEQVFCKAMLLPYKNSYVAFKLPHTTIS